MACCGSSALNRVPKEVLLREEDDSEEEIVFERRRIQLYAIHNNIPSGNRGLTPIASTTDENSAPRVYNHSPIGEHRLFLEDWNRQFQASERNLERKQASCSSTKADLYQILGLFFVFQGVVLTAVAQTSQLTCSNWYLPFLLSLIVFVAAFVASVQKLDEIAVFKEQYNVERALYLSLYKSIENLKERGTEFDLDQGQPELRGAYTKSDSTGSGSLHSLYTTIKNFFSVWVISYAGGVLFLLCTFSAITLFSVKQILCEKAASAP